MKTTIIHVNNVGILQLFNLNKKAYLDFCSSTCVMNNNDIKNKIEINSLIKYGVKHHLSNKEVIKKREKTNIEKYGYKNPTQNPIILMKIFKSQFRLKPTELPSGKIVNLMGYEPYVLKYLLENFYDETDFEFNSIPTIEYNFNNKNHVYIPDFYIPKEKLILEIKSTWTYNVSKDKNEAKAEYTRKAGFNHVTIIWNKELNKIHQLISSNDDIEIFQHLT